MMRTTGARRHDGARAPPPPGDAGPSCRQHRDPEEYHDQLQDFVRLRLLPREYLHVRLHWSRRARGRGRLLLRQRVRLRHVRLPAELRLRRVTPRPSRMDVHARGAALESRATLRFRHAERRDRAEPATA